MRKFRYLAPAAMAFLLSVANLQAQDIYPDSVWARADDPAALGFDIEKLKMAEKYSDSIKTAAVVIVKSGVVVYEWGETDKKYMTHSIRKSFLSALYGNYVRNGTIDLDRTVDELGLNDEPPLSETELAATLRDCIKARSGIYHPALYESAKMKALKPERHTQKPGTHWYYNNWDFNAAGTAFEKLTGSKIFEAIEEEIAIPIQMEDFTASDGWYVTGEESVHPAYPFVITAHDMARFGLLMMRKGRWKDTQVIPADWVAESTAYHSDASLYESDGYGYMWWVAHHHNKYPHLPGLPLPEGSYSARGAGGHYILVIPEYDLVVVHRVNTFTDDSVEKEEFSRLLKLIIDAMM